MLYRPHCRQYLDEDFPRQTITTNARLIHPDKFTTFNILQRRNRTHTALILAAMYLLAAGGFSERARGTDGRTDGGREGTLLLRTRCTPSCCATCETPDIAAALFHLHSCRAAKVGSKTHITWYKKTNLGLPLVLPPRNNATPLHPDCPPQASCRRKLVPSFSTSSSFVIHE